MNKEIRPEPLMDWDGLYLGKPLWWWLCLVKLKATSCSTFVQQIVETQQNAKKRCVKIRTFRKQKQENYLGFCND